MSLLSLFRRASKTTRVTPAANQNAAPKKVVTKSRLAGAAGAGLLATLVAFTGAWEGKENVAYLDTLATKPVWTVCYGETRGVKAGDRHTDAECQAMLAAGLLEFEQGMRACLTAPDALPAGVYVAFLDTTWNIGQGAFCGSSMARKANAGDLEGACRSLRLWNKAGGRVVRGLTNRRVAAEKICLESLKAAA